MSQPEYSSVVPRGVVEWTMEGVPGADTIASLPTVDQYLEARLKQASFLLWRQYQLQNFGDLPSPEDALLRAVTSLPTRAWVAGEVEELRDILDVMKLQESSVTLGNPERFLLSDDDPITKLRVETLTLLNIPWTLGMGKRGRLPRTVEEARE